MTLYFDTSYLFRVYSAEPGHAAVAELLASAATVASAWHTRAEFAAVLLRKRRETGAVPEIVDAIRRQFQHDRATGLIELLPLTEAIMHRLEDTLARVPADTFLRSSDALHLACAAEYGFDEVYSNDRHFLAAAPLFGLRGVDVIAI